MDVKKDFLFKVIQPICKFQSIQYRYGDWVDVCKWEGDEHICQNDVCPYLKIMFIDKEK